jgi:hypothetical protein
VCALRRATGGGTYDSRWYTRNAPCHASRLLGILLCTVQQGRPVSEIRVLPVKTTTLPVLQARAPPWHHLLCECDYVRECSCCWCPENLGGFWWYASEGGFWWYASEGGFWWYASEGGFWWYASDNCPNAEKIYLSACITIALQRNVMMVASEAFAKVNTNARASVHLVCKCKVTASCAATIDAFIHLFS